ncbi:hypothetical protein ACFL38_04610 [Candidatus Omnitrophota bacterium]
METKKIVLLGVFALIVIFLWIFSDVVANKMQKEKKTDTVTTAVEEVVEELQ